MAALVAKAQATDTEEGPLETYNTDAEAQKAARKEFQVRGWKKALEGIFRSQIETNLCVSAL